MKGRLIERWFGQGAPRWARRAVTAGGLTALLGQCGCPIETKHNHDRLVRTQVQYELSPRWTAKAAASLLEGPGGGVSGVGVDVTKDRSCLVTEIQTVDRTVETQRELLNPNSRRFAYPIGGLGAAGAVTNIYFATQTGKEEEQIAFGVLAGIGTYLSIMLIVQIVLEFASIDTTEHVGLVDVRSSRNERCDEQAASGAKVQLIRSSGEVVSEGVIDHRGHAALPVDPSALKADAVYAIVVDGVVHRHIEIPAPKPAAQVAPPASAVDPPAPPR